MFIKKLVCRQLVSYLELNGLMPGLQSAYRRGHSTETVILKIISDLLMAVDRGQVTILGLLDLSSAFDTVDHIILIDRLRRSFGTHVIALSWIESFISNRTQTVGFSGSFSSTSPVTCGVPQGSVLDPVLFLLYVLAIARRHGIGVHSYADDTQLYLHDPADLCVARASAVVSCIGELDRWMCSNRLKLNTDKMTSFFSGRVKKFRRQTFTVSNSVESTFIYQLPSRA